MNKSQKDGMQKALKEKPYLKSLVSRLKSIGGGNVFVVWNDGMHTDKLFVQMLLSFGRVSPGADARTKSMDHSECHENSQKLARNRPRKYQWETGYALSKDGLWRPHSWVWDVKNGRLVETTEKRVKYFGFVHPLPKK